MQRQSTPPTPPATRPRRPVWLLTAREEDGIEGRQILGVYSSPRKAKAAARADAGLPPRSRRLTWEQRSERFYFGTYVEYVPPAGDRPEPFSCDDAGVTTTYYIVTAREIQ